MDQEVTVRELGGEIWAEIAMLRNRGISHFETLESDILSATIDLIMGVLARHSGSVLVNDQDLPVTPLPSSRRRLS
jgi:hypothetical protein